MALRTHPVRVWAQGHFALHRGSMAMAFLSLYGIILSRDKFSVNITKGETGRRN